MPGTSLPYPDDLPKAPEEEARIVQPFQFLSGGHPEPPETFEEHRARKAGANIHPSMADDVPEDSD